MKNINIDAKKLAMTGFQAFISAAFGAMGSYAAHKIIMASEKATDSKQTEQKRKIGFDITG